ncbi:MAG: RraA family protein [Opitutales bacterium]
MKKSIIDYIRRNRVSTTEVADCMGKSGLLRDVTAINRGHFRVGNIKWVYAYDETNWHAHEQIASAKERDIVFIESIDCADRAIVGELVAKYLILYLQANAIVCSGNLRDAAALIRENYPIWCKGFSPIGCFNKQPDKPLPESLYKAHKEKYDGAIAVCDDCGVVIIPKELHTETFLKKLVAIEEQEDIWFDRLDRQKESTFDIVCLKKYLNN